MSLIRWILTTGWRLDMVGRRHAPAHYAGERETIDMIRDVLGDDGFAAFCLGNAIKYQQRAGKKGTAGEDRQKRDWYVAMWRNVRGCGDDPRSGRPDFRAYDVVNVDVDALLRAMGAE